MTFDEKYMSFMIHELYNLTPDEIAIVEAKK